MREPSGGGIKGKLSWVSEADMLELELEQACCKAREEEQGTYEFRDPTAAEVKMSEASSVILERFLIPSPLGFLRRLPHCP